LLVEIEKPVYGGDFLARAEGKAIFTPLTLPGERAMVRVVDDRRGWANAELESFAGASRERVEPRCPHFGACGGCHYQHANYEAQLAFKQAVLRETLERARVAVPESIVVLAGEPWAYRNRIRLTFDAAGNPGYRGRRSHSVVPIRECPIAPPLLENAAIAAAEFLRALPRARRPAEISLFCNAAETALLIGVTIADTAKSRVEDFAKALSAQFAALKGVEFTTEGLAGRQPHTVVRWGADSLAYSAGGFDYRVDHGAFFQVNRWLTDALVEQVTAGRKGELAWDLFAGVGLFAQKLAGAFERVVAVESARAAIPALESNMSETGAATVCADTRDFLERSRNGERPDLIVVDPPRPGLGGDVTALLIEMAAPAITYVSCDPATLARDLGALLAGGYEIEGLTLVDLFPQTFHIESVVQLRRA
jgi:23S rRNA (uracil1939-C5)-methyltransferase